MGKRGQRLQDGQPKVDHDYSALPIFSDLGSYQSMFAVHTCSLFTHLIGFQK
jgi:hypothetical protein